VFFCGFLWVCLLPPNSLEGRGFSKDGGRSGFLRGLSRKQPGEVRGCISSPQERGLGGRRGGAESLNCQ